MRVICDKCAGKAQLVPTSVPPRGRTPALRRSQIVELSGLRDGHQNDRPMHETERLAQDASEIARQVARRRPAFAARGRWLHGHLCRPSVLLKSLRDLAQHDRDDDEADCRRCAFAGERPAFGVPGGE